MISAFETLPYNAVETERILAEIRSDPDTFFRLPEGLEHEGGPFVTILTAKIKKGCEEKVFGLLRAVRNETDANEFSVYSYRILRGRAPEETDLACIIIDYDEPAAFRKHYQGDSIQTLIKEDLWASAPSLSFWRDHD